MKRNGFHVNKSMTVLLESNETQRAAAKRSSDFNDIPHVKVALESGSEHRFTG